jgi:hypothetical protein
MVEPVMSI